MCYYLLKTFRCGHTRKTPIPPFCALPSCNIDHDLAELTEDLGETRAAIRMHNLGQSHLPGYRHLLDKLVRYYPSFFGHGSANGARTLDSLRQLEEYLEGEIVGMGRVGRRELVGSYCLDECWEAVCEIGREEQYRRGGVL